MKKDTLTGGLCLYQKKGKLESESLQNNRARSYKKY